MYNTYNKTYRGMFAGGLLSTAAVSPGAGDWRTVESQSSPRRQAAELRSIAQVATYLPRRCGIATFTNDLHGALATEFGAGNATVLAIDDTVTGYPYPEEVRFQIREQQQADYRHGAEYLNINQVSLALIQHEFGIFGGADGELVLDLVRRLRMPVVCALHTVPSEPTPNQARVVKELGSLSDRLVVLSRKGEVFLRDIYGLPEGKIAFVPHGIPDVTFIDPNFYKDQYGVEGHTVMLTFGLLSAGKGIEVALRALPAIVARHPKLVYVVLGATHPNVLRQEGDAYRNSLQRLVDDLAMREHVIFRNRFVSLEELCGYIGAADIYLTPYRNRDQIVSGTLAYAMGAGKPVVATPYWYAEEMLAEGRGSLVPFGDHEALAAQVISLLDNDIERHAIRKRAYMQGRSMIWPEVARAYSALFRQVLAERERSPKPIFSLKTPSPEIEGLPDVDFSHLYALTDDAGLLQHATYTVPDRDHGYCTDDNARALAAMMSYYDLRRDESVLKAASTYLSFVGHAFNGKSARFRNFMSYDRRWMEEAGSEDTHGRAMWGLGMVAAFSPDRGSSRLASRIFSEALPGCERLDSPRAWAFALVGIHAYLRRFEGDAQARRVRKLLADRLFEAFEKNAEPDWPWCENEVTYVNAKLPHALILSGQWLPDGRMVEMGLRALEWLLEIQTAPEGHLSVIGNNGWLLRSGERAHFDQQPVEAFALAEACAEAYYCTQDDRWADHVRRCLNWFLGLNDRRAVLYDFKTGGCRDGLHPSGVNENQGAESTLAWLITLVTTHQILKHQETKASSGKEKTE